MKAILVLDMPNYCYDCPCYYEDLDMCEAFNKKIKTDYVRPSWCPLKPMPNKKPVNTNDLLANAEAFGWNVCLYVITGETE